MPDGNIILVIGATGNQGGATARELVSRGRTVHALVRDPGKAEARQLEDLGVVLVQGDMDDEEALRRAMEGVHGVFSVQPLGWDPEALAAEVRQGKAVADACRAAGVAHLVYSSVGGAERSTRIDHFETKAEIEQHIRGLGLPATVLRPVFFMNNLLHFADAEGERLLALPAKPEKPIQLIASDDIGFFAATAFDEPDTYLGRQIELAGDEVTFPEIAKIYERVTGVPTRFEPQPIEDRMFEWFAEDGYQADIPALRKVHPGLLTFEQYLTRRLAPADQA
ncbi:NmrA/HSCARG family protein [Streptomyces swartbergensis]|uniref:NmrA family transcriptional regulator n=1 Tax=Streptomyces swartbergensis TaxID=487165 RepID=A0A243S507_9ACTN|nr:NmrA/HSCARG family protein [Streptomyces swartbergensis]OUD02674.1 NmrA family transcriptional regulator [Streptomyces swartbergensis]